MHMYTQDTYERYSRGKYCGYVHTYIRTTVCDTIKFPFDMPCHNTHISDSSLMHHAQQNSTGGELPSAGSVSEGEMSREVWMLKKHAPCLHVRTYICTLVVYMG